MSTPVDPIQELVTAARRTQILDAATKVFAEKGFHRATIKDIARMAGIADGTIYNYFENKTDVLLGILDQLNETAKRAEQFATATEGDFRSFLIAYLRHRFSILLPNQAVFQAVIPELLSNAELRSRYYEQVIAPSVKLAEEFYRIQIEAGHYRQINVPITVRAIAGMFLGLLMLRLLGDEHLQSDWEHVPEALADLILDGVNPANMRTTNGDE